MIIERGDIGIRVGANFVIKTIMTTIPPLRSGEGLGEGSIKINTVILSRGKYMSKTKPPLNPVILSEAKNPKLLHY